jgi:methylenetetrahydrofolate reductase (NADPH)
LKYIALHELRAPVLANVYVLGAPAARFFHAGKIPGVTVTDELLAVVEKQAASLDRGRAFFLELAARQCAIAKGLGYRGIYLGGHLRLDDYDRIFQLVDSFGETDWIEFAREIHFSQHREFYYFEPDPGTGLNSTEINRQYLRSKVNPPAAELSYRASRLAHQQLFEEGSRGFRAGHALYQVVERSPGLSQVLHRAEQALKILTFDCRDCGDCSLPEIAYLCPESQCAKNQRNGPCGGTRQGLCEVGEKECIWSRAYSRLKAYGEEERMLEGPVVFRDGALRGTSAWANSFLGRDHRGKKSS